LGFPALLTLRSLLTVNAGGDSFTWEPKVVDLGDYFQSYQTTSCRAIVQSDSGPEGPFTISYVWDLKSSFKRIKRWPEENTSRDVFSE
jgi:hypothetical protein